MIDKILFENCLNFVGQLKWKKEFCGEAKYFVHVDDDVFVNIEELTKQISTLEKTKLDLKNVF